jgi:hypothetical protein
MEKKTPISGVELSWKIVQRMRRNRGEFTSSVAIVADPKSGWRAVLSKRSAGSVGASAMERLISIEKALQASYTLRED